MCAKNISRPTNKANETEWTIYFADMILVEWPNEGSFTLKNRIDNCKLSVQDKQVAAANNSILKFLNGNGYISQPSILFGEPPKYCLTVKGISVKDEGGHQLVAEKAKKARDLENKAKEAGLRKKIWDYKIKWLVALIAVATLLVAVAALFKKDDKAPATKTTKNNGNDSIKKQ